MGKFRAGHDVDLCFLTRSYHYVQFIYSDYIVLYNSKFQFTNLIGRAVFQKCQLFTKTTPGYFTACITLLIYFRHIKFHFLVVAIAELATSSAYMTIGSFSGNEKSNHVSVS